MKLVRVLSVLVLILAPTVVLVPATFAAPAPAAPAQGAPACPDQQATNIPAHTTSSGPVNTCRSFLNLLGLSIVVGKKRCPTTQFLHPAHQECHGDAAPGMRCRVQGWVQALRRECSCQPVEDSAQGVSDEHCRCSEWVAAGTFEDAETVECDALEG